jgi:hypothetical protein
MNAKLAKEIEEQAKALGNAYLPGAQAALHRYTTLFAADDDKQPNAARERRFGEALDQLCRLHALVKQGRLYLKSRLDDPALKPETDTAIAAWLGHAWQLSELKEAGLVEANVELVQLAFNSHDDVARKEYVDTGVWMALGNGRIRVTQSFRPYQAAKHLKSEDSFFQVAQVSELCAYPGNANPRIRWDGMVPRPLAPADLEAIRRFGQGDFATAVKEVRALLKGPLADRQPIHALNFKILARAGEQLVAVDAHGHRLALTDEGMSEEPPSCHLFGALPPALFADQTLIVRFRHDLLTRRLEIKPLSIVAKTGIVRLTL